MTQTQPIKVKCPLCNATLVFPAERSGQRLVCQHCGGKIKVPGQPKLATDEDNWLRLDDEPPESGSLPAAPKPTAAKSIVPPATSEPTVSDEFWLPDLDDAAVPAAAFKPQSDPASPQTKPPASGSASGGRVGPSTPPLSEADLAVLAGFGGEPPVASRSASRVDVDASEDDRFRVRCPVCDSLTYARTDQVGKRIRCPDCESVITVPPRPKPQSRYQPDMATAPVYRFSDTDEQGNPTAARPQDPFRKSADDLLRAAELAEEDSEETEWELPSFSVWFSRLGKTFRDPAVAIHVGLLSLLAYVPVAIWLKVDAQAPIIVLGMFAGGIVFAALVVACGFAILQSVANGEESVSEWPVFDPLEWFGQVAVAMSAGVVAAGPIWMVAKLFGIGGMMAFALAMFSLYLLYPIVLMSMLDEQSVFVPFSTDVSKSIVRAPDQWGAAYLASTALFGGLFFAYLFASACTPLTGAAIAIVVTIAAVFLYFGILGQLAYGIGHAINAPPMVNNIDRGKPSDDHDGQA